MVAIVDQEASDKMTTAIHKQKLEFANRKSERQQQLDAKIGQNNAGYEEQQAAIQANRDAMRRTLDEDRQRRDQMRNKPNATIEAKKAEIASKNKELAALSKRANELPPIPSLSLPEFQAPDLELADRSMAKVSATGIFSGFAARSIGGDFGTGSPMERTARASEKTAKNTDAIKKQGTGSFTS